MKKFVFTAFAAALLLTSGQALADQHGSKGNKGERFEATDTNGDGYISFDEMSAKHMERLKERFTKMDTDKDGKLSKEEIRSGREKMRKHMKERMKERKKYRSHDEEKRDESGKE